MSVREVDVDPSQLTADQRLDELAAIFAEAVRRLRRASAVIDASDSPESSRNRLEFTGETGPHGPTG